jgi:hypothetical protein
VAEGPLLVSSVEPRAPSLCGPLGSSPRGVTRAMEVIKPGISGGWSIEQTCTGSGNGGGGCQAVLRVSASDLYLTSSNHHDGSSESYVTFMCPQCSVETDVRSSIPSGIRRNLPEPSRATVREWQFKNPAGRRPVVTPGSSYPIKEEEPEQTPDQQRRPRRSL